MVEVVCGVRMGVGVGRVGNGGEGLVSSEGNVSMADGGRARWRDCCRFPMRFSESSGKTSHTVSHSHWILVSSFCGLACKEEEVKVIEAFIDQCARKSVGGSKGFNGVWTWWG